MSSYSRDTELRSVQPNDLYHLAVILDENDYWRKLMEIIPRELNNQLYATCTDHENAASSSNSRKYERDHIRLIENAFKRSGESRLCPQILFDEWGSSGRKHERPTLGVLLHLLSQAQLIRAADYVAVSLLKEAKPTRPTDGPGAEIPCDMPTSFFNDVEKMANDSEHYPDTELLQINANGGNSLMDNNKDYCMKYREPPGKHIASLTMTSKQNDDAPIPPPRLQKSMRLLKRQEQLLQSQKSDHFQMNTDRVNHDIYTINEDEPQHQVANGDDKTKAANASNIPKISLLMNATNSAMEETADESVVAYGDSLPQLSFLRGNSQGNFQVSAVLNGSNSIPNISNTNNNDAVQRVTDTNCSVHQNPYLPAISALNLNGERDINADNVPTAASNSLVTNSGSSNIEIDFNVPSIVTKISRDQNSAILYVGASEVHVFDETIPVQDNIADVVNNYVDGGYGDNIEDDDDEDVPNLSIFNDSSLTSVTNTSGDNSFDQSVNDSGPTSTDSSQLPNII